MPIDVTIQLPTNPPPATPTAGSHDTAPTTTAFQLHVDRIVHTFNDDNIPITLPSATTGTDQLRNQVLSLGFRTEEIQLSGILVDRGTVSASNPRRQTLLDIARVQWTYITQNIGGGGGGGADATTLNPNAYLLLVVQAGNPPSNAAPGSIPGSGVAGLGIDTTGATNAYRGLIRELSFTNQGGRPDIWEWTMRFTVVMNEHDY